ncbi:MAG TPA: glycine cleavage system protein GcvH [Acidimicrobiales bacterium]|nr:glycine cleavage system protein GcvH [Acidimicrobiales bacterium]
MNVPDDLRYTTDHEWVRPSESAFRVGLTDFAQDALGDVVFVELPAVGAVVSKGGPLGEVESTKSVSQIYAPVSGTVVETNEQLRGAPELLNSEPYGEGWICAIQASDPAELDSLLGPEEYRSATDA